MEKRKPKSSASGANVKSRVKEFYREFLLTEGKRPSSVFVFCKQIGIKEAAFYKIFTSFESIEKTIWSEQIESVISRLSKDENYTSFSAREKILTFYFALFESFKADRSFLTFQLKSWKNPSIPSFLKQFNLVFAEWSKGVIEEGIQSGEIAKRPYFNQYYYQLLWMHFLFVLKFWSHDESADFEKTDVAIEKSVTLAFDLIGKGVLDNAIDFGKFLYQTARN
ncbi:MAG TPA: hypothetical protein DGG95_02205 [Cytophagales bacterium]|jgi:hypothetical protein|nr:hypothetical protein [Cytophagales bacterium]